MPNVAHLLRDHVSLSIACIDRIYVNGWMPKLQTSGGLVWFLTKHLGKPIASPALFGPIHDRFVNDIHAFAADHHVPEVDFARGERKDDVAAGYRSKFTDPEGVVFIGVAQEKAWSFKAHKGHGDNGVVSFDFSRQWAFVNHYYFYVQDAEWGPAFVKVGSYLPYPVRLCLNGHEWAKQQLRREGIGFESLDNGFLSCEDPVRLQAICDRLGPSDVQDFFNRWCLRLPWPLTVEDRQAGYLHKLSLWQIEMSLTEVFDRPVHGREFFDQLIRDNLDLGRPDRVSLLFPTRLTKRTPPPTFGYRTRIITDGVQPSLHVDYKSTHVKQYFKEGHALRTETTINDPKDLGVNKAIEHMPRLRSLGQEINRKLLEVERISQDCHLSQDELETLQRPVVVDDQRVPALRFGDMRVMALMAALCLFLNLPDGFSNRGLRRHLAALLGVEPNTYTPGRMTYDLRRLRLRGLIERIGRTNRYRVVPLGLRIAYFYTKVFRRILRPGWAALIDRDDSVPRPLRAAFREVDREIARLCEAAVLRMAA